MDMVEDKKVLLVKVDTLKNALDALKKYVRIEKFSWCRETMGVIGLQQWLSSHVAPRGNKITNGRMLGVCYILSMTLTHGGLTSPLVRCAKCSRGAVAPLHWVRGSAKRSFFLDPILSGWTYLWFYAWISHMVLGMMVFCPWYFVDLVKGIAIMF